MSNIEGANTTCWLCGSDIRESGHADSCPNKVPLSDLELKPTVSDDRTQSFGDFPGETRYRDPKWADIGITELELDDMTQQISEQVEAEEVDKLRENAGDPVATESTFEESARECIYRLNRDGYGIHNDDGKVCLLCSPDSRAEYADLSGDPDEAYVAIDGATVLASPAVDADEIIGVHTAALRPHPVYSDKVLVIEPAGVVRARIEPYETSHGYVDLGAHEVKQDDTACQICGESHIDGACWDEEETGATESETDDADSPFDLAKADATRWRAIIDDRIRQFHQRADTARSRGNPERQRAFRQAAESLEVVR